MSAGVKYLFIGGAWDGRREEIAASWAADLKQRIPPDTYLVQGTDLQPVSSGRDYCREIPKSSVTIWRLMYTRATLHDGNDYVFVYIADPALNVIQHLILNYKRPP